MDLFCIPDDPAAPTEDCPYVSTETWDGGLFRLYLHRKGRLHLLPPALRNILGVPAPTETYIEHLYPTPAHDIEPLLQTWLFFGLTAEFFALNETAPGIRLIDQDTATHEIAELHKNGLIDKGGIKSLSGKAVLGTREQLRDRIALAPDISQRVMYLRDCLHFACLMIQSIQSPINFRIHATIVALGELLTTGLYRSIAQTESPPPVSQLGFNWFRDFVKSNGEMEHQMLRDGWCPNEIEKARSQYLGVFTLFYMSRLKRSRPNDLHKSCSVHACRAFQIDMLTYKPSHEKRHCPCKHLNVEEAAIINILESTPTFPVLRIQYKTGDPRNFSLIPEAWEKGIPYVALSHVWADGMGNPKRNSVPKCRLHRVINMIKAIQEKVETNQETGQPYRLWIDTLCCPVRRRGKLLALERIASVYMQATHVLVLDSSITSFKSQSRHPAELFLRMFTLSPWMRRLWTLQEGVLARSLFVQWEDGAVDSSSVHKELFAKATEDLRYLCMWHDASQEYRNVASRASLEAQNQDASYVVPVPPLVHLQKSLHYRTVTVPSDEPLCIATLMSLDSRYISSTPGRDERMSRVWELVAKALSGLPIRMLFFVEEVLDVPGWRWAPRSLLSTGIDDPFMTIDQRIVRFTSAEVPDGAQWSSLGIPTSIGLKVQLPGCHIVSKPYIEGTPLHPWSGLINSGEEQLLFRDGNGRWARIFDMYRSGKQSSWIKEEEQIYDAMSNLPLCRSMHTGNCALIYGLLSAGYEAVWPSLMVQVKAEAEKNSLEAALALPPSDNSLCVRRERGVLMAYLEKPESDMMDKVQVLAERIASDPVTAEFSSIEDRSNPLWEQAAAAVREKMKQVMADAWREDDSFASTMRETYGDDLEQHAWVLIPKWFSHRIEGEELPGSQVWYVD